MPSPQRFKINPDRVVHETIEEETVVIHLETGAYYSLNGTAAGIWEMLDHGWSSDQAIAELARRFDTPVDALDGPVRHFVRALEREELIERSSEGEPVAAVPANGGGPASTNGSGPAPERGTALAPENGSASPDPPTAKTPASEVFVAPELQKYTDMQYFLLLDPVHEVEASGWPHSGGLASH